MVVLAAGGLSAALPGCGADTQTPVEQAERTARPTVDASTSGRAPRCPPPRSAGEVHGALRLGVAAGYTLSAARAAEVRADLDGMAGAGACWVRIDLDWGRVERRPGQLDWTAMDRAVLGAIDRDMQVLALVGYTPGWARPEGTTDKAPPDDVGEFADFVRAAVDRYAPLGVHAWEVWNEPNISQFWQPRPDPGAYARLLVAAASAIRDVDPDAIVVSAGLSPAADRTDGSQIAPVTFLRGLYDAGAQASFDAVGVHPYSFPVNPTDEVDGNHFATVTPLLREVMVEHGDGETPIWATEYGAPTAGSDNAVTEADQADFLRDAVALWDSWPWTGPLLVYSWRDRADDRADRESNFGLVRFDGTPKPALDAFRQLTAAAGATG